MEIWKDIKGYKGKYQVSNLGRIKSLTRYIFDPIRGWKFHKERILKQAISANGYYMVGLSNGRERVHVSVHRLIGFAFIPNPENKPCINHKNGIKKRQ